MTRKTAASLLSRCLWLALAVGAMAPADALAQETPQAAKAQTRRYALVIGSNDGGAARPKLRYGTTDAQAFSKVLRELGGVPAQDQVVLLDPDRPSLDSALTSLQQRLAHERRADLRQELIVYYSGHSDDEGLLLFGERYPYARLRQAIQDLPVDVRVAILDSCASGAVTRTKGGARKPAFLVDESTDVKGTAFLTSASESEAAQESDKIGASFFTHYLISGLRGGADVTHDGQVTLTEAYQFAFRETLARTETSLGGAQHPAYDMQLSGTGDLVLTDLRATSATLILEREVEGRVYVRDAQGNLVAELYKPSGRAIELGLAAGEYQLTLDDKGTLRQATLTLTTGKAARLTSNALALIEAEDTRARGDAPTHDHDHHVSAVHFGLLPGVGFGAGGRDHATALNFIGDGHDLSGVEVGALANLRDGHVRGPQIAGVLNTAQELDGVQIGGVGNLAQEHASGVQVGGTFNLAGPARRLVQVGGVFNLAQETSSTVQVGGVFNLSEGAASGAQVAGVFNISGEDSDGVQVAGVFNLGGESHRGLQLAGVFNQTDTLYGLQIGLLNIAGHVEGSQIGLINISEDAAAPIGLVSFARDGILHAEVWGSDVYPVNGALKIGGRYTYTVIGFGSELGSEPIQSPLLGLGGRIPLGERLNLDLDAVVSNPSDHLFQGDNPYLLVQARASLGFELFDHLSVFGGVAQNTLIFFDPDATEPGDRPDIVPDYVLRSQEQPQGTSKDGTRNLTRLFLWPGFFAGVRF